MTGREPYFFKRWRAREAAALEREAGGPTPTRNVSIVDAALATSAAPTYFPSHGLDGRALVDGGVFASNPALAAIAEALKRDEDTTGPGLDDLLVVSIGTGVHEEGFSQSEVSGWGRLGWILPHGGEPPLLGAVLDGASDAADHWAHMLVNHAPGTGPPNGAEIGRGPRYFRLQVQLTEPVALDDASQDALGRRLPAAAAQLIEAHSAELDLVVERLLRFEPLPPDPPRASA